MKPSTLSFLLGLSLSSLASARTDLEGCVSSEVVINYGASYLWYVPDTGEICTFLDCGGGRAPPKTNQPGCPLYSGTATVTASYIEGYGPNGKQAASTNTAAATTSSTEAVETTANSTGGDSSSASSTAVSTSTATDSSASLITAAPTSSPAASMTTTTSAVSSESSAASSTPTGNAAHTAGSNVGVVALMAMVGAMVL
ncbi:unnamed protein product [Penicillium salamii]|uniref:Cell wall protein n=1 Tax=Penicillium salamii TaxID=1612424 RepID=A0A9W4IXW8_9EURO|nr:unnamed protein product [Penicillium salamii]CAG8356263.1 unnamed protein product [Penicillium salamii]CAG8363931.1 unnamed protein product [Penicillium salamii]CAG8417250.1 unnamed protein product [Penicillium salamii]